MRVIKEYDERRKEIVTAAAELFFEKGYEAAGVSDILKKVNIAKGTFYYYFKSKEEVLDAVIEAISEKIFENVEKIANNRDFSPLERLLGIIMEVRLKDEPSEALLDEVHKVENALLHQKILASILHKLTPFFVPIIEEGNQSGVFCCKYPEQGMQILLAAALTLLDEGIFRFEKEKEALLFMAMFDTMEKILGVSEGDISKRMLPFYEK